jgi:ABC-type multidrug transport system fused ATPase/permease subunit
MTSKENLETTGMKGKMMAELESGKASQKPSRLDAHYASSRKNDFHMTIEWEDLNYYVVTKDSKKSKFMRPAVKNNRILNNVSGRAESGQLLAIMGPTGCGESIL